MPKHGRWPGPGRAGFGLGNGPPTFQTRDSLRASRQSKSHTRARHGNNRAIMHRRTRHHQLLPYRKGIERARMHGDGTCEYQSRVCTASASCAMTCTHPTPPFPTSAHVQPPTRCVNRTVASRSVVHQYVEPHHQRQVSLYYSKLAILNAAAFETSRYRQQCPRSRH